MTTYYPIVLETEASGAVSAYVPGLPVYAAADTHKQAERAIREVLMAYLDVHPHAEHGTQVRVARVSDRQKTKAHVIRPKVSIVGVGALLGSGRSRQKARAARANGQLGGRPRKSAASRAR